MRALYCVGRMCALIGKPSRSIWCVYRREPEGLFATNRWFYTKRDAADWCSYLNKRDREFEKEKAEYLSRKSLELGMSLTGLR